MVLKEEVMEKALELPWSPDLPPLLYRMWLVIAKRVAFKVFMDDPEYLVKYRQFPVSAQDGTVVLGKARTRSASSFSSLSKAALVTVPMLVCLNTDRSRLRMVECRSLPFSASFLWAVSAALSDLSWGY